MRAQRIIFGFVTVLGTTHEVQAQRILFVNQTAQGAEDGSSWEDAFVDLQDALAIAQVGDEIWVTAGTYKPDLGTGDRLATFRLVSGVGVYGGFAGWEECREERDWMANETILSGDLAGDDGPFNCDEVSDCCRVHDGIACDDPLCQALVCNEESHCCDPILGWQFSACATIARVACCHLGTWRTCENSHFVITAIDCGSGTGLDGFTLIGAYFYLVEGRDEFRGYFSGAGVFSDNSMLVVANCKFIRNYFAGIMGTNGSSMTLLDSSFYDHRPGASVHTDVPPFNVTAVRCTFFDNARKFRIQGSAALRECSFFGNSSAHLFGNASVDSCAFLGANGLQLGDGRASVTNSRFIGNTGHLGIEFGSAVVDNCVFVGSTLGSVGVGFGSALFRNCAFINNYFSAIVASFANIDVLNCTIFGNGYGLNPGNTNAGGIELDYRDVSCEVLNSIIWGNGAGYHQTREEDQIGVHFGSTLEIDYSIVEGWSGALGGPGNDGNFGDDPLFVDPDGPDDIPGTEDDDVRLSANSPAINAGFSTSPYNLPTDLDGHARILCGNVDIGAYEFGIGDFDCNRSVSLSDFAWFPYCMTGPTLQVQADRSLTVAARKQGESNRSLTGAGRRESASSRSRLGSVAAPGCESFDFNADLAIDLRDLAGFQRTLPNP